MDLTGEVGLRLPFSPISSNIVFGRHVVQWGLFYQFIPHLKQSKTMIKMSSKNGFFIGQGAKHLYMSHLRPFLLRHQAGLDQILEFIYNEMGKIISAYQAEIKFARALFMKLMASVNQIVQDLIHPVERQPNRSIGGQRQLVSDTQSDSED